MQFQRLHVAVKGAEGRRDERPDRPVQGGRHSYHRFTEEGGVEWDRLLIQAKPLLKPDDASNYRRPAAKRAQTNGTSRAKSHGKTATITTTTVPAAIDRTWRGCTLCMDVPYNASSEATAESHLLQRIAPSEARVLLCGHQFHAKCLAGWGKDSITVCPNCREESPLPSVVCGFRVSWRGGC